ncbi:MAG: baseplate J/gp47 family protein [Anaerolineae bacterium]|nr:MAG: baseplate J/gp47 family protein [Anaerolineae bacterium]
MSTEQVLHLEKDDDIDVIREKLERAQARKVLLVVPHGSRAFKSPLDFRLLRRQAGRQALEVALVSNHPLTRDLAAQEGVRVYGSIWRGKYARHWALRRQRPPRRPKKRRVPLWRRMPSPWRQGSGCGEQFAALMLILATVAAVYGLIFYVVPTASVTLVPATQPIQTEVQVVVSRDVEEVDWTTGHIPAKLIQVQVEDSGEVPTTGKRDAADSLATGSVVFINQLSQPVTVVTDTIVSTSLGTVIRFRTTEAVELAPAIGATAAAPIEALEPGSSGNVDAQLINKVEGAISLQVRVTNPAPTVGGGFRQVGAVTAADKNRLRSLLLQQLQQRALAEMQKELGDGEAIVVETVQVDAILAEDYDQFVGEPAEFLGLEMRALVSALAYREDHVRAQAFRALSNAVPDTFSLINGTQTLENVEMAGVLPEGRTVSLTARAGATVVAAIDQAEVHRAVQGKPPELARLALTQTLPLAAPPDIQLGPDWMVDLGWLERVPQLSLRILVQVQETAPEQGARGG